MQKITFATIRKGQKVRIEYVSRENGKRAVAAATFMGFGQYGGGDRHADWEAAKAAYGVRTLAELFAKNDQTRDGTDLKAFFWDDGKGGQYEFPVYTAYKGSYWAIGSDSSAVTLFSLEA